MVGLRGLGLGLSVIALAGFYWSWNARGDKIDDLRVQLRSSKARIEVVLASEKLANKTTDEIAKRLKQNDNDLENTCKLLWENYNADETDALGLVLDRIDGLSGSSSPDNATDKPKPTH